LQSFTLFPAAIGFNKTLIVPFLIINFFCGIQHGNTNTTPNIMIADCVDEIEYKTGKRQDGIAYAGYGLFSKVASAIPRVSARGCFTHLVQIPDFNRSERCIRTAERFNA
jgi:Na+/melibiose symporter-like transporter